MVPIESLNALNRASLQPLCKGKMRSKSVREKLPHSSYLMPFKPRWRGQPCGHMYVETIINCKPPQAMLDMGADTVYMAKELADEVDLSYTKEKGFIKGFNARSLPIEGVTRGALMQIGLWQGKANITVASLDDKMFYLGIDFLDMMKTFLEPYANTMCIMEKGQHCVVPLKRENDEGKMLSVLQFTKGIKKKQPTFLVTLKFDEEVKEVQAPKAVQEVLDDFKNVMPAELPKRIPPKRKVDHAIELEPRAKPPAFAPYRMVPPELEELRWKLKELLDASYICVSKSPYGAPVLFQKKQDGSL